MALDAGNEDLAKKALAKKAECDTQVNSMKTAVDNAQATSEKLKQQVGELKRKIEEGERTAGTLVARKNAAVAQRKVSEAMAGVGSADNAFAALNRFEQTVAKEEATAKAFDQLASAGKDDDLEKEFAQLGSHSVDAELAALKAERQKADCRRRLTSRRNCRARRIAVHRHQGRREDGSVTELRATPELDPCG